MLLEWEWGVKEAFQDETLTKYMVTRKPASKQHCELKFDIIKSVLQNDELRNMIAPPVVLQLKAYYAGGVYGEKAKPEYTPEYATKNY